MYEKILLKTDLNLRGDYTSKHVRIWRKNGLFAFKLSNSGVPIIDHNPRQGIKEGMDPNDAIRYRARSGVERTNGRLKDEFGGRNVMVQGAKKVFSHLMFGLLALSTDQLIRLIQFE